MVQAYYYYILSEALHSPVHYLIPPHQLLTYSIKLISKYYHQAYLLYFYRSCYLAHSYLQLFYCLDGSKEGYKLFVSQGLYPFTHLFIYLHVLRGDTYTIQYYYNDDVAVLGYHGCDYHVEKQNKFYLRLNKEVSLTKPQWTYIYYIDFYSYIHPLIVDTICFTFLL